MYLEISQYAPGSCDHRIGLVLLALSFEEMEPLGKCIFFGIHITFFKSLVLSIQTREPSFLKILTDSLNP